MSETLSNLSREERRFPPPPEFTERANVGETAYADAATDRLAFWETQARRLAWAEPWDTVLDWSGAPFAKWFVGGKLNVAYNCVDRHVEAGHGDQVAYHWEGEPGDTRTITYAQLKDEVCKAANALTALGVRAGDRVAIYLPMIPETVISMLACARLGAPHTVVFGGFSSTALSDRIIDCDARVVITADGGYRRGAPAALKAAVDEAVLKCPDVRSVLVVRRTGQDVEWTEGRDEWWHDLVDSQPAEHTPEDFDAEHPLYVMYTSGTTGRPKGAQITYRMCVFNAIQSAMMVGLTALSRNLVFLPTFHTGGLNVYANPTFHTGGCNVVMRSFEPAHFLRLLSDRALGLTHALGVPTNYLMLAQEPGFAAADFSHIVSLGVGGAAAPLALIEQYGRKGIKLQQCWGMTETGPVGLLLSGDMALSKVGSSGLPPL
jgi:acyl-coenzyme A synthetase/AMP-(fatty) acid ligase